MKYPPATRGTIVVWGLLASSPFGGMIWQVLHYLVGFRRLGYDVWYVEDSERPLFYDLTTYDPIAYWPTIDYTRNVKFLSQYMNSVGLGERWIFRPPDSLNSYFGSRDAALLAKLYREADAVFNLCGANELRPEHEVIQCLVYLQTDPVAQQVLVANGDPTAIEELDKYDYLFSYGENLGAADCLVPVTRYVWHPTRPPICVDWWPTSQAPSSRKFTTVGHWRNHGKEVVWEGETYHWQKEPEFRRFIDLPSRSKFTIELALIGITDKEKAEMRRHGWQIVLARDLSDAESYQEYIRLSAGEFSVAKDQNIRLRSGWFSDRSACYLAAGRPVIMQDTGFGNILPTGEGLFAFSTEEEALSALDTIAQDYDRHSFASFEIAKEYFEAERVLGDICRKVGLL